ncbi:MAG TPA: prenyltransferase/squalene oxidase repeat-containing protein [Gemmataceae bacterium]|jgi:hypothetical protein|nr:prenyltransferase/squalene oxidase repeat-containing protein [Gemmataceae bacterium]
MKHLALLLVFLSPAALFAQNPARAPKPQLDQSIEKALEFLNSSQNRDGSWSAGGHGSSPAISALCVMAFMSAGHIPGEGKYGDTIRNGIDYVLKSQAPNGLIARQGQYEMYSHGICTLMLAEVVGMTDGKLADEVRLKLEKAVAIILKAQRKAGFHKGGWRYTIQGDDADISCTGWQLMALRAAKNVGCDVPPEAIESAVDFVKKCNDPSSGGYRYLPGAQVTVACTGTSILALELCGKEYHRSPAALKAGSFILKNADTGRSRAHYFYGIYYCSQAMFQLGDNYWNSFRDRLYEQLFANQNANGAWSVGMRTDDGQFGPNYCTSMAVLALTVEYRFLPIYQRDEQPMEEKK